MEVKDSGSPKLSAVSDPKSFTMPAHAWPNPGFTFTDRRYNVNEVVTFTDDSRCYRPDDTWYRCGTDAYEITNYLWNFGDGKTTTTKATTTHAYQSRGRYTVSLSVTDGLGTCTWSNPIQVRVGVSLPEWKEIAPF